MRRLATTVEYLTGFLHVLGETERTALRAAARPRTYPNRMPLCHEGDESDHVVVIESGWAKVTSATESGHEVMLAIRGPGDLVCEGAVLGHRRRSGTVAAISPLRSLIISAGRFIAFLDEFPRTWQLVSETVIRRLDDADRRVQAHAFANGTQRLAQLLVELSEHYGEPTPDGGIEVRPPLSQEELAAWVDCSRETVARALKDWRTRRLVRTGWRRITVLDLPGLRSMCP